MNRRDLIHQAGRIAAIATCAVLYPAALHAQADKSARDASIHLWRERVRKILKQGKLPIIDTQATLWHTIDIEFIVREMDTNNVAQVAFAPNFSLGSASSIGLHKRYPQHFIPTTADASSWHWDKNPQHFVDAVISEFKSGNYFMMGEYELRHYPSPMQWRAGNLDRDITVPLKTDAVHDLFRFSQANNVPFTIHYEIEDALLPPLEDLLERYPGALVVWAHVGQVRYPDRAKRYDPRYVRSLIARFPNLHFDLGSMVYPGNVYPASGARDMILFEFTGNPPYGGYLKGRWRELFDAHPERFLAATDIDGGRWKQFPMIVQRLRNLVLEKLSERSRHLIAYQNAWRLVTTERWSN
jgi:hypothetical protein